MRSNILNSESITIFRQRYVFLHFVFNMRKNNQKSTGTIHKVDLEITLLPFYCSRRFRTDIINNPINTFHTIYDLVRGFL